MKVVKVNVENLSEDGGLFATPVWVAAHDGDFDVFNKGEAASESLERLAEDGSTTFLEEEFDAAANGVDGVIFGSDGVGGIVDPGETASINLEVNEDSDRFFSFASMVIPSNDAFVGNEDSKFYELFDESGNFVGSEGFAIYGSNVYDAGTEVNTELDAAFINQTGPNTGVDENGTVQLHNGYIDSAGNPGGTPIILGGTTAAGTDVTRDAGDFTQENYELLNFSFKLFDQKNGTDGNDFLRGGRDNDILNGGLGNDNLNGDRGDDILNGGEGNDRLIGDRGNDELNGGEGNDTINAGRGDDTIDAGDGDDRVIAGRGNDIVNGGEGNDVIRAGRGDDTIDAGNGENRIFAERGNDVVVSGDGDDFIRGGRGNDTIDAGAGNDIIFGGRGDDTFIYRDGYDDASIRQFSHGSDIIELDIEGVDSYADLLSNTNVSTNRVSTSYEFENGDVLSVYGSGALGEDDFSFI